MTGLEFAMHLAKENKHELRKVLEFYSKNPEDSLKYKAALFLIEGMPYHYSIDFTGSKEYYEAVDSLLKMDNMIPGYSGIFQKEMLKIENNINWQELTIIPDIQNIQSSFLISHIESAFKLRDFPWYGESSFDDFCEYILPYRIMKEPTEDWLPVYNNSLLAEQDTLRSRNATDSMVCNFFINHFFEPYEYKKYVYRTDFHPSSYLNMKIGTCKDLTAFGLYTLRSMGINVAWDFTPQWGNRSKGHDWLSLVRPSKSIPFAFGDRVAMGEHLKGNFGLVKAYRRTYSPQKESLRMKYPGEKTPSFFTDPCMKDVSELYFNPVDLHIDLLPAPHIPKQQIAYICAFNNKDWIPVHWAEIADNKATFSAMNRNSVYRAMYFDENILVPASRPFLVDSVGNINYLVPDTTNLETVFLKRKYMTYNMPSWRLIGGRFQGANKSDFSDAVDLYIIDEYENDIIPKYVTLKNPGSFSYFRYFSAPGAHVYMAEIELFDENDKRIKGSVIGTEGSYMNDGSIKDHVFDQNPLTFFNAPERSDCWAGLEFGKKEIITRLTYMPRNDDNFICINQVYELFYFGDEWVSLGKKTGDNTHVLIYDNVPEGALLLLKNHTKGVEERFFTYENGEQIWW